MAVSQVPSQTSSPLPRRHAQRHALRRRYRQQPYPNLHNAVAEDAAVHSEEDFYNRKRDEHAQQGPSIPVISGPFIAAIAAEREKWDRYITAVLHKENPSAKLVEAKAPDFKTYLEWRLKHARVTKLGTAQTYWHTLSAAYSREAKTWIDGSILFDVSNWLKSPEIMAKYGLSDADKEKARLYVNDLVDLQLGHWVRDTSLYAHERIRLQLSPVLILAGCTSTRPAALVGKKPLLYRDFEFQVFFPPDGPRPLITMTLNLKHIKRSGGTSKPKKFRFYEGENILCCPVLYILALAIADNAFLNEFTSLQQMYNLTAPSGSDRRLILKWKSRWEETPVFRDVEKTTSGTRISETKPMTYPKFRHHFIALGRTCGFRKQLQFYDFRRGSGKMLNEALTPEERRHIMGNKGDVYERRYTPSFIDADCQAIYLGTTRMEDLLRSIGRLERHDNAPTALSDEQLREIQDDEELVELKELRESYSAEIKALGYPTLKAAANTTLHQLHQETRQQINALRLRLQREMLHKVIEDFHESVHTKEVDRQMDEMKQGRQPAPVGASAPRLARQYEIEERAAIVRGLFETPLDNLSYDQTSQLRVDLVDALQRLCSRKESPRYTIRKSDYRRSSQPQSPSEDSDTESDNESVIPPLACPFCLWKDVEAELKKRQHSFADKYSLNRHIQAQHLACTGGEAILCPYPACTAILGSSMHFFNHAAREHDLS